MKMYKVVLLKQAEADLKKLDREVARRIARRLEWLSANADVVNPMPLAGQFAGFYKLRVGSYRVVYELLREKKLVVVYRIRHRKEVYRRP